jgi:hypothetical protein
VSTLRTGWWLFPRCAEVCSRVNAYADRLAACAACVGTKPPMRVSKWLARLLAGDVAVVMMTEGRGFSNGKATRELGWKLRYPSWRQGFKEGLVCPGPRAASGSSRSPIGSSAA